MATRYFATLDVQIVADALCVQVRNTGAEEIPWRWVHLSGTVQPPDGSWVQEVAIPLSTDGYSLPAGASSDAFVSLPALVDGSYRLDVRLWVRDATTDHCYDEAAIPFTSSSGLVVPYRPDVIADAELGPEFAVASGGHQVRFDPLPYLAGGELVVTVAVDGPEGLPAGSWLETVSFVPQDVLERHELSEALAPGATRTWSLPLPTDLEPHNYLFHAAVYVPGLDDAVGTCSVHVCYQDQGPVEVLYG